MSALVIVAHLLLWLLAVPAVFFAGYVLLLTLLSARVARPLPTTRQMRFDIIVPAHNEAAVIARTVASLRQVDWPADAYRVLVCADNCSDNTAALAREAGAAVIERSDSQHRGKGYALDYAFGCSRDAGFAQAVVVIDADVEVSRNLLEAIAARIERGAQAVQVHYGILNPHASWRTRLITIAKGSFHIVRSRARERLGLSCGIRGTGWCVTHALLQRVPYRAFSLTEDVEFGIDLGLAGCRVAYADEAHSDAEMVSGEQIARKQRQRWERGRFELIRSRTLPLLRAAIRRRSALCLDLGLDLLMLPLSYVFVDMALLLLIALLAYALSWAAAAWLVLALCCAFSLTVYVLRGWQLSGIGLIGLWDLARAPLFVLWKLRVLLSGQRLAGWERTERERGG